MCTRPATHIAFLFSCYVISLNFTYPYPMWGKQAVHGIIVSPTLFVTALTDPPGLPHPAPESSTPSTYSQVPCGIGKKARVAPTLFLIV